MWHIPYTWYNHRILTAMNYSVRADCFHLHCEILCAHALCNEEARIILCSQMWTMRIVQSHCWILFFSARILECVVEIRPKLKIYSNQIIGQSTKDFSIVWVQGPKIWHKLSINLGIFGTFDTKNAPRVLCPMNKSIYLYINSCYFF